MKKILTILLTVVVLGFQVSFAVPWDDITIKSTVIETRNWSISIDALNNHCELNGQSIGCNDLEDLLWDRDERCKVNNRWVDCDDLLEEKFSLANILLESNNLSENLKNVEQNFPNLISFGITVIIIWGILSLIGFIFRLWMLIDAAKYQENNRVVWILIIIFLNALWALIYLLVEKLQRNKKITKKDKKN